MLASYDHKGAYVDFTGTGGTSENQDIPVKPSMDLIKSLNTKPCHGRGVASYRTESWQRWQHSNLHQEVLLPLPTAHHCHGGFMCFSPTPAPPRYFVLSVLFPIFQVQALTLLPLTMVLPKSPFPLDRIPVPSYSFLLSFTPGSSR